WDSHARRDPLWAILSEPTKKGRQWDLQDFLRTGEREIFELMRTLVELDIAVQPRRGLDFGCGVGRLTRPVANYFVEVVGLDISAEMIRLANMLNREPFRVQYVCNARQDLTIFPASIFTFACAHLVFQH